MPKTNLPPEISEHVVQILCENERAFCTVSDKCQEGGHPLPINRVDENGNGGDDGRTDVLVVKPDLARCQGQDYCKKEP